MSHTCVEEGVCVPANDHIHPPHILSYCLVHHEARVSQCNDFVDAHCPEFVHLNLETYNLILEF